MEPVPVHTSNTFEDFSGITSSSSDNPYDALIDASQNDPVQIQARYSTHRSMRNAQQKAKLLAPDFDGVQIDPVLLRLSDSSVEPGYADPRHCLVFWARPPQAVKNLIAQIQQKLLAAAPNLWLMPPDNLHMTTLEITHSQTASTIHSLVASMRAAIPSIVNYTQTHRARLVRPLLSFDAQALALSFVPAAGESLPPGQAPADDAYSYHHLRRDVFALSRAAGVAVESRYVVPSAHLTVGRFVAGRDFEGDDGRLDRGKVAELVEAIDSVNEWLVEEFWPKREGGIREGGEWIVGQEKGLNCRMGTLWYGGGEDVELGKGF
ncbi:RNA ligase/cyclic nucleotide phosphodiesterase [Lineolata rhizophorae]|uniref:RNA ligase/cyclic nucleotide phosphodiesterase n=1 Tax=Lineolata rhizophorae TaxID=578093 RepID=A0A6A6NV47_9PEZI|nr:RNA ligase/cyclic nucleotide phosphodiesterase [Lineolata rhizophorae]